jgi:hypothetical protein
MQGTALGRQVDSGQSVMWEAPRVGACKPCGCVVGGQRARSHTCACCCTCQRAEYMGGQGPTPAPLRMGPAQDATVGLGAREGDALHREPPDAGPVLLHTRHLGIPHPAYALHTHYVHDRVRVQRPGDEGGYLGQHPRRQGLKNKSTKPPPHACTVGTACTYHGRPIRAPWRQASKRQILVRPANASRAVEINEGA